MSGDWYSTSGTINNATEITASGAFKLAAYTSTNGQAVTGKTLTNAANITGVTPSYIYGGYSSDEDSHSGDSEASNNKVYLNSGSISNVYTIYGGYASTTYAGTAKADNNEIHILSGTYNNTQIWAGSASGTYASLTTGNKIYIYGDANLNQAVLAGGNAGSTGNTLYFGQGSTPWSPANSNYTIQSVANFSTIMFNAAVWDKTITIGTLFNSGSSVTVDATNVAFTVEGGGTLSEGDSYDMLKATTLSGTDNTGFTLTSTSSTYTIGTNVQGNGTVSVSADKRTVTYTIGGTGGNSGSGGSSSGGSSSSSSSTPKLTAQPQTHGVAMAAAVTTTALTQGSNTASVALANLSNSRIKGVQTFSAIGGGASRVETGSHVTVKSLNLSVGVGSNYETDYGLLTYGVAFEAGYGRFKNSYNAGAAEPYVSKKGHVSYTGGVLIGNFAFNNDYHINALFRMGRAKTQANNALYDASTQTTHSYKISSMYVGLELGGGKIFRLDDKNSVDLYTKYYYLHQGSDDFKAGGNYHVHGVTSHRLLLAGRYQYDFSKTKSIYAGLGGEYEFDGKAKVSLDYGVDTEPSKVDGFRGYAETGFISRPEGNAGLYLDVALKGHYGSRYRDAMVDAEIKYLF